MSNEREVVSGVYFPVDRQAELLRQILLTNPVFVRARDVVEGVELPNWYLGGGAIPQIVWNHLHGSDPNHGIEDFDVVYFDSAELSAEGEASRQQAILARLPDAPVRIEVVSEARTHLWYGREFGREIAPYTCTEATIFTFPTTASAVGVSRRHGRLAVYALHGLSDLFGLVVRANKVLVSREVYERTCRRWSSVWPMVTVVPW
jgi:hypothetical protein